VQKSCKKKEGGRVVLRPTEKERSLYSKKKHELEQEGVLLGTESGHEDAARKAKKVWEKKIQERRIRKS